MVCVPFGGNQIRHKHKSLHIFFTIHTTVGPPYVRHPCDLSFFSSHQPCFPTPAAENDSGIICCISREDAAAETGAARSLPGRSKKGKAGCRDVTEGSSAGHCRQSSGASQKKRSNRATILHFMMNASPSVMFANLILLATTSLVAFVQNVLLCGTSL